MPAAVQCRVDGCQNNVSRGRCRDTGMTRPVARRQFVPRGAVDLAVAYHKRGDQPDY